MPHLSPTTLTTDEQRLILRVTVGNVRDHTTPKRGNGGATSCATIERSSPQWTSSPCRRQHRAQTDHAVQPVAERCRGTLGRDRAARSARPRDRPQRAALAPAALRICRVLPQRPDAPRAGQEHAVDENGHLEAESRRRDRRPSANRWPASSLRVAPSGLKARHPARRSRSQRKGLVCRNDRGRTD